MLIAEGRRAASGHGEIARLAGVAPATMLPLAFAWGFDAWRADLRPSPAAFVFDVLVVGTCFVRRCWRPWAAGLLAAFCLPLAAGLKAAYVGLPLRWPDVDGLYMLLAVLPSDRLAFALVVAAVVALSFVLWLCPRPGRAAARAVIEVEPGSGSAIAAAP